MKLHGKVALITGGAQGLGKAIAVAMGKKGAHNVIGDVNVGTLPMACSEMKSTGARCLAAKCDVTSVETLAGLFQRNHFQPSARSTSSSA